MNVVVLSLAMHCLPGIRHLIRDGDQGVWCEERAIAQNRFPGELFILLWYSRNLQWEMHLAHSFTCSILLQSEPFKAWVSQVVMLLWTILCRSHMHEILIEIQCYIWLFLPCDFFQILPTNGVCFFRVNLLLGVLPWFNFVRFMKSPATSFHYGLHEIQ